VASHTERLPTGRLFAGCLAAPTAVALLASPTRGTVSLCVAVRDRRTAPRPPSSAHRCSLRGHHDQGPPSIRTGSASEPRPARGAPRTGAASGIGRAIAARLESDGSHALSVDLEPEPGGPGEPFGADLITRARNRAAVEAALERFGRLDVLIANAGFQHVSRVSEFPEEQWDRLIAVLLTSPFLLAKYAERTGPGRGRPFHRGGFGARPGRLAL
jgi:hypothetical protein